MEKEQFAQRMIELRMKKGVSARDMSLSLGQSAGYINNIENGVNLPSLTMFFYICDYFGLTPEELFSTDQPDPIKAKELFEAAKGLRSDQLDHLIALVKDLKQ